MKIIDRLKAIYRSTVDHLTKALGAIGIAAMSWLSTLDPAQLRNDVQTYLGPHAVEKLAGVIFGLVIARGFYTGWKHSQDKQ